MKKSPAAERNKEPLLNVLKEEVFQDKQSAFVLEVASGTGQHASYFAENLPQVTWQPTECDQSSIDSIKAYKSHSNLPNLQQPVSLNAAEPIEKWANGTLASGSCDVIMCVNMIHISPWNATQGLFNGCSHYLKSGGVLITYGPYKFHGEITPESNVKFDQMLKLQNNEWGLRDVDDLEKLAHDNGMKLEKMIDMPANNKTILFRKS